MSSSRQWLREGDRKVERESLLALLIVLLGGVVLQPLASWLSVDNHVANSAKLERRRWWRLWLPILPMLTVAAWLCGWALVQPDPVRDRLDPGVLVAACAPFALLFGRAVARAIWSLLREPGECGVCTVGFLRPQVVFSPFLARQLDEAVIHAALGHERAHAWHYDPLRIWLAQLATDLQWPWPSARRRLESWLAALEQARDDEARAWGVSGADLAAAVLASARFGSHATSAQRDRADTANRTHSDHATLIGESRALQDRVSRLLAPVAHSTRNEKARILTIERAAYLLIPLFLTALVLGAEYGDHLVRPLLALMS
jgi:hypothetical protein